MREGDYFTDKNEGSEVFRVLADYGNRVADEYGNIHFNDEIEFLTGGDSNV